jgi:hypothetical protein
VNLQRWFEDRQEEKCRRCGRDRRPTLAHILNDCIQNCPLMTKRHNPLANVMRNAVMKFIGKIFDETLQRMSKSNKKDYQKNGNAFDRTSSSNEESETETEMET